MPNFVPDAKPFAHVGATLADFFQGRPLCRDSFSQHNLVQSEYDFDDDVMTLRIHDVSFEDYQRFHNFVGANIENFVSAPIPVVTYS